MEKISVLLAEDDENLGQMIQDHLELENYKVELYKNGEDAWKNFRKGDFDILLLDVMMPKKDGYTLASEIRKVDTHVPIIFLTAKSQKEDKIEGFKAGADDYITKPFNVEELMLRIEAILRRSKKGTNTTGKTLFTIGDYAFNSEHRTLSYKNGEELKLTTKEAGLLEQLCTYENQILERDIALKAVWGNDNYFTGRSMDVYITKIRKYLKEDSRIEIQNIHGSGYRLITNASK